MAFVTKMDNDVICLDSSESENGDKVEDEPSETNFKLNASFQSKPSLPLLIGRIKIENCDDGDNGTTSISNTRRKPGPRKRIYTCSICKKELVGMSMYKYHMKSIHRGTKERVVQIQNNKSYVCQLCKKRVSGKGQLTNHMRMCHGAKNNSSKQSSISKCPVCNSIIDEAKLDNHLSKVHKTSSKKYGNFLCPICDRRFCTFADLLEHEMSLHKQKDASSNLNHHSEEVHEGRPHEDALTCSKCQRQFSYRVWLLRHERVCGSNEKTTYSCSQCPAVFTLMKKLDKHERNIHFRRKPNNKTMLRKKHLIPRKCKSRRSSLVGDSSSEMELPHNHIRNKDQPSGWVSRSTLGGVKLIYADKLCCSYCPKFFSSVHTKHLHEKIHTGDYAYQCKHCKATFRLPQKHADHESKCLKLIETIWCPFCDYQNKLRYKVENHCKSFHEFDMSNNRFFSKNTQPSHVQTPDEQFLHNYIPPNDVRTSDLQKNIPPSDNEMIFVEVDEKPKVDDITNVGILENEDEDNLWSDFIIIDD